MITPESIESGVDLELSRITSAERAMIFLKTGNGSFAIASCQVSRDDGKIARVYGVFYLGTHRLGELDHAVVEARRKFGAEPAQG
jgi:hypothetical protein